MNIKTSIIFLVIFFSVNVFGQLQKIKSYPVTANLISVDPFENIYVISKNSVKKSNNQFQNEKVYTNNNLGEISGIDVQNPFKILLFYKDYNMVIFLDNTLNILGSPLKLDDIGIYNCQLACNSNFGGFWVFDQTQNQIAYIDKNLQIIHQSGNIGLINDSKLNANYMVEYNQNVYLNFPGQNVLVFNKYGGFLKKIPVSSDGNVNFYENKLFAINQNKICTYHLLLNSIDTKELKNQKIIKNLWVNKNKFYIFSENTFLVFKIID